MVRAVLLYGLATLLGGAYTAVVLTFRFAATDGVPPEAKARALATVIAGGVLAGLVGRQLLSMTMDLVPGGDFIGTYLASDLLAALTLLLLRKVDRRVPIAGAQSVGRPFRVIARKLSHHGCTSGLVTFLLTNFFKTSAALAMRMHGLAQHHANTAVQWHVVAMYASSFVVCSLITRFGAWV